MFESLKKKLSRFKKKASETIDVEEGEKKVKPKKAKGSGKKLKPKVQRKRKGFKAKWSRDLEEKPLIEEGGGIFSSTIKERKIEPLMEELEMILYESDVAVDVVQEIRENLEETLVGKKMPKGKNIGEVVETGLRNAMENALKANYINFDNYVKKADKPAVLMFVGINGTGKTTAIARVAYRLKRKGHSSVLAASDTFRAGAIEQLDIHANKLGLKIIKHKKGSDPAAIAFDAVEHAKARRKDVVLIDTAGRMHSNINLMEEMKKIKRVAKPDMIIFVGDALAGNDAVEQAKQFDLAVGIDAVILTKIDADAKGGAALSIAHSVGKPILFIGVGQDYKDMIPFHPKWMVKHIF